MSCLKAGRNVYVEKPFVLNIQEGREIERELSSCSSSSSSRLVVAHYRRALPAFVHIKKIVQSGVLGRIRCGTINLFQPNMEDTWRVDPSVSGGGLFHDLAPHQIDLFLFILGAERPLEKNRDRDGQEQEQEHEHEQGHEQGHDDPTQLSPYSAVLSSASGVSSSSTASGVTNTTTGYMTLSSQSPIAPTVHVTGSWVFGVESQCVEDKCTIVGEKGTISFNVFGPFTEVVRNCPGEAIDVHEWVHDKTIQRPMIENVVSYFKGDQNSYNPCSLTEAMDVVRVMDAFTTGVPCMR
jgi:predicted dehydrogenase